MRKIIIIWASTFLIYSLFLIWYSGLGLKFQPEEIEQVIAKMQAAGFGRDPERLRHFMLNDDGKDFVMVNLLAFNHPEKESMEKLQQYSGPFIKELLTRAGHPVFFSRGAGPAAEYWGLEKGAENWNVVAAVRYRSRRDLIEMVMWPEFRDLHPFKEAALEKTLAFPASPWFVLGGARLTVGLILALIAALATAILKTPSSSSNNTRA